MPFYIKWIIIAIEYYLLGSLSFSIIVSKGLYKKDRIVYNKRKTKTKPKKTKWKKV